MADAPPADQDARASSGPPGGAHGGGAGAGDSASRCPACSSPPTRLRYVSLTNAIAVGPTDTMPLTRRAKGLMAVESLISYAVAILVIARAVNVLSATT